MNNVVIIGCGIAGSSHIVECVFHPNINVLALCSRGSEHAMSYAKRFNVPYYFDFKTCLKEFKNSIDAVIFSIPPNCLEENLKHCDFNCMKFIDKPGIFISDDLITDNIYFYYSRRSFLLYSTLFFKIREAINQKNNIKYRAIGPYIYRYSSGKTYLASTSKRGVILDTLCHFWELLLDVSTSIGIDITIRDVKMFGKPETQCQIVLDISTSEIIVEVFDSGAKDNESWSLHVESNVLYNSPVYSITNHEFEKDYVLPFADQIYDCFTQRQKGIFLDIKENNRLHLFVNSLYSFFDNKQ